MGFLEPVSRNIISVISAETRGVFLCIRCSGIHRSMGTHISKGSSARRQCYVRQGAKADLQ
jgi:hypothetical protein